MQAEPVGCVLQKGKQYFFLGHKKTALITRPRVKTHKIVIHFDSIKFLLIVLFYDRCAQSFCCDVELHIVLCSDP